MANTFLIDASVFIFRAWFSIPDSMTDDDKNPVNAVYGFARFLGDFLEREQPEFIAAAFDVSLATSFRNEIFPDYKANREPAPPELKRQFDQCRQVTEALGVMECADESFEADDLIGTLAAEMRDIGHRITIVSRDKDLLQILQSGDALWDWAGDRRIDYHSVPDSFGVRAEQMVDYLALAGDSVDNIPGAPGVGPKTASALLSHFESLQDLYRNLDRVADLPLRGSSKLGSRLAEHREQVMLSRELAQIRYDVPVESGEAALERREPDIERLHLLYDELGFGDGLRRQARRIYDSY